MAYRYLDFAVAELIADCKDVHFFCACGRHVMLGPEDFVRWPNSTLHRIAARMRCTGCRSIGLIPEIRLTATASRGGHTACVVETTDDRSHGPISTTHQRRRPRNKGTVDGINKMKRPKALTGRALKDALMPRVREIARTGHHNRWLDVVLQFEAWEQDALRYHMTDNERDELEMIALSVTRFIARLPPCCPVGAFNGH